MPLGLRPPRPGSRIAFTFSQAPSKSFRVSTSTAGYNADWSGTQGVYPREEMGRTKAVVELLKEFGKLYTGTEWAELDEDSLSLVRSDPFAFLIAVAFDQGMPWQQAWQIPAEINRRGCLDAERMASMSQAELIGLLDSLPRRPRRGTQRGARTLSDAARLVCERFNGDAGAIWTNSSPAEVQRTLQGIYQIGPGIASMATRILYDDFGCFRGQEWQIDVKPDTHLIRVFRRVGFIDSNSEKEAVSAARHLNPEFPGALDWPAWRIGNLWCHPTRPDCPRCPLTKDCLKRILAPEPAGPPRRTASEQRASVAPRLSKSSAPGAGEDPDYSVYPGWVKASEESRALFRELKTMADQLGRVRTDVATTVISFKCMAAGVHRAPVFAYVYLRVWSGLRVLIHEKHVRDIPLEDGFTRPNDGGQYREIVIRDWEQIRRAEPLLRAAYDRLSRSTS